MRGVPRPPPQQPTEALSDLSTADGRTVYILRNHGGAIAVFRIGRVGRLGCREVICPEE